MKIAYLFNSRIPTEKAHGLQIMQMCSAFAKNGHEVTLFVPGRRNPIDSSAWEYYGMEPSFNIRYVPVIDFITYFSWMKGSALWLTTGLYALSARFLLIRMKPDLVYSRDTTSAFWVPKKYTHIFEAHTFPRRAAYIFRAIWKRSLRIVTMTDGLKQEFIRHGFPEEKLIVAPDAVDPEKFRVMESKRESRMKSGLPLDDFLVVYVGRPYKEQGVATLSSAAKKLEPSIKVVLVGAEEKMEPCLSVGRVPHDDIPRYLNASDVAVMPYTGKSEHVSKYASPMKLFEYLAVGKAIVSSDLPSIREILNEETAEFVPPDDAEALAGKINALAKNPSRIAEMESAASRLANRYTWTDRADAVLKGVPRTAHERFWTWVRKHRAELGILLLAFFVRASYVSFFPQHDPASNDSGTYLALADAIRGVIPWTDQPQYFQPGYPYLLALLRSISENLLFTRIVQALISTGTVAVTMLIARRWVSPKAGIFAGLLSALYVPMILDIGVILTETTFTFLLTLGVFLFLYALECKSCLRAIYAGAALALAGFVREIGFYIALLLAIFAGLYKKYWRIAVTILVMAFFSAGIISLQSRITGESIAGGAPLIGKGYEQTVFNDGVFRENAYSPGRLVMYPEGIIRYFLFPYRLIDVSDGTPIKSAIIRRDIAALKVVWPQVTAKAFLVLFHWLIVGMAFYGIWKGKASRDLKISAALLILFVGGAIVFASVGRPAGFDVYEPLARYRFPVEPLIILLAAAGIERWTIRRHDQS